VPQILVCNKIDRVSIEPKVVRDDLGGLTSVSLSALSGAGVGLLRDALDDFFTVFDDSGNQVWNQSESQSESQGESQGENQVENQDLGADAEMIRIEGLAAVPAGGRVSTDASQVQVDVNDAPWTGAQEGAFARARSS